MENQENLQPDTEKKRNCKQTVLFFIRLFLSLVLATVVLLNIFTYIFQVVSYNGTGMEPTLFGGQTLLLLKTQKAETGDIIAFYYNNQVLVRRVICTGGSQIEIDQAGSVLVNGRTLNEPYVTTPTIGQCNLQFPFHIRTGTVFVMGDNRTEAMDSRLEEIGTIPTDRIIGKVLFAF